MIRQIALDGRQYPGLLGQHFKWLSHISKDTTGKNFGVAYHDEPGNLQFSLWGLKLSDTALMV